MESALPLAQGCGQLRRAAALAHSRRRIAPGTAQSGIVYERIEDRPAGTMDSPNVISAITAAICTMPTLRTIGISMRLGGLMWTLRNACARNKLNAPKPNRIQAYQSGLM